MNKPTTKQSEQLFQLLFALIIVFPFLLVTLSVQVWRLIRKPPHSKLLTSLLRIFS